MLRAVHDRRPISCFLGNSASVECGRIVHGGESGKVGKFGGRFGCTVSAPPCTAAAQGKSDIGDSHVTASRVPADKTGIVQETSKSNVEIESHAPSRVGEKQLSRAMRHPRPTVGYFSALQRATSEKKTDDGRGDFANSHSDGDMSLGHLVTATCTRKLAF